MLLIITVGVPGLFHSSCVLPCASRPSGAVPTDRKAYVFAGTVHGSISSASAWSEYMFDDLELFEAPWGTLQTLGSGGELKLICQCYHNGFSLFSTGSSE